MKKKYYLITVFMISIVCIGAITSFYVFRSSLQNQLFEESKERLEKSDEQASMHIRQIFAEYEEDLEMIAEFTQIYSDDRYPAITSLMDDLNNNHEKITYQLFDLEGELYQQPTHNVKFNFPNMMKTILEKKTYISNVIQQNKQSYLYMAVPIMKEATVIGGVMGCYPVDYLTEQFSQSFFEGIGATMIIEADGSVVSGYQGMENSLNFFTMLQQFSFPDSAYNLKTFRQNIKAQKSGFVVYDSDQKQRYVSYQPIGINDWYVINLVMAESLSPRFTQITSQAILFASGNVVLVLVLVGFVFFMIHRMQKNQKELLDEERFRFVTRLQHSAIVFEHNFKNKLTYVSDNFEQYFGYQPTHKAPLVDYQKNIIHTGDYETLVIQLKQDHSMHLELELKDKDGNAHWFNLEGSLLGEEHAEPTAVIGFLYDIHATKMEKNRLIEKARQDGLTKTLSKSAMRQSMTTHLTAYPEKQAALFFIDIDNFKEINDGYGHLTGDEVLKQVAANLIMNMRDTDEIGRFGGDEFVLFMQELDRYAIQSLAQRLQDCVKQISLCHVSISIGVSLYPDDARTLEELLQHADEALYQVKRRGKGGFQLYSIERDKV